MFGQDRDQLRRFYCQAWAKAQRQLPLEPLEQAIVQVVQEHPEYQKLLEDEAIALGGEFPPELGETNPFLHMGMHLALREQIATDRPGGIAPLYHALLMKHGGDGHRVEHQMMDCLGEALWQAQRQQTLPDEQAYLDCLKRLARL